MKYFIVLSLTILTLAASHRGSYTIYDLEHVKEHNVALGKTLHIHAPCNFVIGQQTYLVTDATKLDALSLTDVNLSHDLENSELLGLNTVCKFNFSTEQLGKEELLFEKNERGHENRYKIIVNVISNKNKEKPVFADAPLNFFLDRNHPNKFLQSEKGLNKQVIQWGRPFSVQSTYNQSTRYGHLLNQSSLKAVLLVEVIDQEEGLLLGGSQEMTYYFTTDNLGDYQIDFDFYNQEDKSPVSLRLHTY